MRHFILLGSGTYFDYENPEVAQLTIEDVAHSLAYANRFAGQCRDPKTGKRLFYSVAEHCVRMSHIVPPELAYAALLHEAGEATCGDVPGPLKRLLRDHAKTENNYLSYNDIEKRCQAVAMVRFGVGNYDADRLKRFDLIMLATERRDLMRWDGMPWPGLEGIEPHGGAIVPWPPQQAADEFVARYEELRPKALSNDA